jgi:hypothetical protein
MSCSFAFTHYMRDDAVYWGPASLGAYGTKTFDAAVGVAVKWFERQDIYRKPTGEEAVSSAVVHVQDDMEVGGYIWRGSILALSVAEKANPQIVSGAKKIEAYEKTEVLSGGRYVRRVFL